MGSWTVLLEEPIFLLLITSKSGAKIYSVYLFGFIVSEKNAFLLHWQQHNILQL